MKKRKGIEAQMAKPPIPIRVIDALIGDEEQKEKQKKKKKETRRGYPTSNLRLFGRLLRPAGVTR